MDRARWLAERRAVVEQSYTSEGATYDDGYDPATETHRRFVAQLIASVPSGGSVLDAACGTAPYAGMVLEANLREMDALKEAGAVACLTKDQDLDVIVGSILSAARR